MNLGRALLLGRLSGTTFADPYTAEAEAADFRQTFLDTPHGLRVLTRLIDHCHWLDALSHLAVPGVGELTHSLAYQEGRRSVAGHIAGVLARSLAPLDPPKDTDVD